MEILNIDDLKAGKTYSPDQKVEFWMPIYGPGVVECLHIITTLGAMATEDDNELVF